MGCLTGLGVSPIGTGGPSAFAKPVVMVALNGAQSEPVGGSSLGQWEREAGPFVALPRVSSWSPEVELVVNHHKVL